MRSNQSPSQTLLSTIYKQSWHPLASTKYSSNSGSVHGSTTNGIGAETFYQPTIQHKKPTIQRPSPVPRRSKTASRRENRKYSSSNQSNLSVSETPYTVYSNYRREETGNTVPEPVLRTWRRRLKTCLESNSRELSAQNVRTSNNENKSKHASPCMQHPNRKEKHEAIYKPYKILNYQNATLTSICVQGKDPPVKRLITKVSHQRPRTESEDAPPIEDSVNDDSVFEVFSDDYPSPLEPTSSLLETDTAGEEENGVPSSSNNNPGIVNTDATDDVTMNGRLPNAAVSLQPSPFSEDKMVVYESERKEINNNVENVDATCKVLSRMPNLEMISLEYQNDEDSTSSVDDDSDISDQELSSDEDDDHPDEAISNEKESRLAVEKYKHLYEHENMSEPRSSCDYDFDCEESTIMLSLHRESNCWGENSDTNQKYEFAPVFPKQFNKYNLKELSSLPCDVNWRTIVKSSDLSFYGSVNSKRRVFAKTAQARAKKNVEDRNKLETLIDRILTLEKLQAATMQREMIRKYHLQHVRAAALKQRSTQNRRNSFSVTQNETKNSVETNDTNGITPRTQSRRRSSVTLSSSRRAWVNEMTEEEKFVMQEACRSGDVDVLLDNWISKRRASKAAGEPSRRSSESGKLGKRPRSRLAQPQFYDYTWSERGKEDKVQARPYWNNNKLRPACQTCREKMKKLNQQPHNHERNRRPSTASSYQSSTRGQPIPERNVTKQVPPSKLTCRAAPIPSATIPIATSMTWQRSASSLQPSAASPEVEKDNHLVSHYTTRRKQYAHVYPVLDKRIGRQDLFSTAFKISPVPFNHRLSPTK